MLETQAEALGPDWTIDPNGTIFTDTDFTSAAWAYYADFDHTHWQYSASFEIHTFRSPAQAKARLSPSPMAVNVDKDGNYPAGWAYVPAHADRFTLDCRLETTPAGCYGLLVYQEYSFVFAIDDVGGSAGLEAIERFVRATDAFMYDFFLTSKLIPGRRHIPSREQLGLLN